MKPRRNFRAATPAILGMAALVSLAGGSAEARINVDVNGQPVYFRDIAPMQVNGRVYIPLRDVAESLNADVRWDPAARAVIGARGGRSFTLPIGGYTAYVEGSPMRLDSPARIMAGRTMVPLRFAAEALGAEVAWNASAQRVAINLPGADTAQPIVRDRMGRERVDRVGRGRVAGEREEMERVVIPADTVVRAELDTELSSGTARVGERFTAVLDEDDRSRFPQGTRFEGRVTHVQRATRDRPGVIDATFDRAIMPDGRAVRISGNLASLDGEGIRRAADGRLEANRRGGSGMDWKWVGIGAAGGAILGGILGDNDWLKGALLGGLGGAAYSYINRGKNRDYREVELDRGTEFGIVLNQRVAFNDRVFDRRDVLDRDFDDRGSRR